MIRNGHTLVDTYRMNFVEICLLEIADNIEENLRYNSLSTRLSNLDDKSFQDFMKEPIKSKSSSKSKKIEVDHEAQMRQFMQG